jgi:hypothetical protein
VNPFLGLSNHPFLDARRTLCEVRDCDLLPSRDYFRHLFQQREITVLDVEVAYRQCIQQYPDPRRYVVRRGSSQYDHRQHLVLRRARHGDDPRGRLRASKSLDTRSRCPHPYRAEPAAGQLIRSRRLPTQPRLVGSTTRMGTGRKRGFHRSVALADEGARFGRPSLPAQLRSDAGQEFASPLPPSAARA